MITEQNCTMLCDFYQLTMGNGYYNTRHADRIAYFDVFFRKVPDGGGYAVCAGLEQVINYIQGLHFTDDDIQYLRGKKIFSEGFLEYLRDFKFTGDIWAVPEGTPVFPSEPLLTVRAPAIQAQLIETMLLLLINHQSLIATKANRIVRAAQGRAISEFGSRRAQGASGAVLGARAAYIGGCAGTACVIADELYGVPATGTMAHSWVQMFDIKSSQEVTSDKDVIGNADYAVEFRGVSLKYKNAGEDSLTGMDFAVKRGETVGIIGGTGSGKSSLVNMIPRFYDATAGEVLIGGRDVKSFEIPELRERIGIVPQKAVLFKGSIRDNMRWGKDDATDDEILAAAKTAQAADVIESKGGLDFEIEQGGKNLSGGQRQRFTIARALVRKPEILILDDSASALDFATDAALRRSIREMDTNPTVFIVSQRTSSIQHADKIIVLDDGKIAGIGKHDELLNSCPVYSEIYNSQFKKEAV